MTPAQFNIDRQQVMQINKFVKECHDEDAKAQGKDIPYLGPIGGAVTYSFTPTSLGVVLKVSYEGTHCKRELDLTDYEKW